MTWSWEESPVALEKLDDHLKALLRLKIREFVHLSPCFKDVPTVDPLLSSAKFVSPDAPRSTTRPGPDSQCPNRKLEAPAGRRHVRVQMHVGTGLM
jgi:hypothetical protein